MTTQRPIKQLKGGDYLGSWIPLRCQQRTSRVLDIPWGSVEADWVLDFYLGLADTRQCSLLSLQSVSKKVTYVRMCQQDKGF